MSSAVWDQVPRRSVNTYAAPVSLLRPGAPTRAVLPRADRANDLPKSSNRAPWEAVSSAVRDQVPCRSVNTYAAPVPVLRTGAPTRAVVPRADRATESPNSPGAAVSSACWE